MEDRVMMLPTGLTYIFQSFLTETKLWNKREMENLEPYFS